MRAPDEPQKPITWDALSDPHALLGDVSWSNYTVSSDVLLEQPGYAELIGRANGQDYSSTGGLNAYHLRVSDTGAWSILNSGTNGTVSTLAHGTTAALGTNRWHTLALTFSGTSVTAVIDGATAGSANDRTWAGGQVGYATSQGETAQFDNLSHPRQRRIRRRHDRPDRRGRLRPVRGRTEPVPDVRHPGGAVGLQRRQQPAVDEHLGR